MEEKKLRKIVSLVTVAVIVIFFAMVVGLVFQFVSIAKLKAESQWGSGFYESLSRDLKEEFPNMKGFSVTNLKYCRRFYELYNQSNTIRQQVVDDLRNGSNFKYFIHYQKVLPADFQK